MREALIAAVVLAAGMSSRMGRPKQILPLEGVPMLERVLEILRKTSIGKVVVVLGANAAEVKKHVKFDEELVVVNRRFAEGMSSSLRLGLRHVGKEAKAIIVVLGDQPFVLPLTLNKLVAAYENSRARIVVPTYKGARGNPVLFDKRVFPQIAAIRGDTGAKSVVRKNVADVLEVEVSDSGVLVDVDTPSDLNRIMAVRRKRNRAQG